MIPIHKLSQLSPGQRRRKLALLLSAAERELVGAAGGAASASTGLPSGTAAGSPAAVSGYPSAAPVSRRTAGSGPDYVLALARLAAEDPKVEPAAAAALRGLGVSLSADMQAAGGSGKLSADSLLLRLCNTARHAILAAIGTFPAEWDLIHRPVSGPRDDGAAVTVAAGAGPPAGSAAVNESVAGGGAAVDSDGSKADNPAAGSGFAPARNFFPGMIVYAEDIRSPFNLGSIFRTAEAFGAERVIVSPLCVPPEHPRAARSAMGTMDYLPWERLSLEEIPEDIPVFVLETGGTPIDEFVFPEKGIVIIGSEELGVSPEALARATYGRVTIPMHGIKSSLNVGVAFGVLMQAWTSYLICSASKPF